MRRKFGPLLATSMLAACSDDRAPTMSWFGAYFPAWLLCALIGVVASVLARVALGLFGGIVQFPQPLLFCSACGVITGCTIWLMGFGH